GWLLLEFAQTGFRGTLLRLGRGRRGGLLRVAPLDLAGVVAGGDQVGDRDAPLAAAGLVGVGQLAGAEAALDRGAGNRAALRRFREGPGGSVHASTVSPRRARALAAS